MKLRFFLFMAVALLPLRSFAACERERGERDKARAIFLGVCLASEGLYELGKCLHPVGGLLGLAPAVFAPNQLRILEEKENALKNCEQKHYQDQTAILDQKKLDLAEQKRILDDLRESQRIGEINSSHDALIQAARNQHRTEVQELMRGFIRSGRNVRSSEVRMELQEQIQQREGALNARIDEINQHRTVELASV